MKNTYYFIALMFILVSCRQEGIDYSLEGDLPPKPEFSMVQDVENPNKYIVTDLSEGNFTRLWDFGSGALPLTSKLATDTVLFIKKGDYRVRLHISATDGNGTNFNEKPLNIPDDAILECSETLAMLTADCVSQAWGLSPDPGSVIVGPEPLSSEWFSSNGLEPTQLDDRWGFTFEDGVFDYQNMGSSFSACQGFIEDPNYPVPPLGEANWTFVEGVGFSGTDQITLTNDISFMGVEDSGPTYDIIELTDDHLLLLTPIKTCDGSPSPGFFTLKFIKH